MRKVILFILWIASAPLFGQVTNDNMAQAIVLQDLNGWSSGVGAYSNVGATADGNGGTCGGVRHNIWFKFQATSNEVDIRMTNDGTLSYPFLTLYDGSGSFISCNKNTAGSFAYIQNTLLIPGSWYYFTADDGNIPGTFSLSITDHIGYDLKANAVVLTNLNSWSSAVGAYSNVNATADGGGTTCGNPRRNVWFKFQATTNEIDIRLINNGTLSYPLLTLYDGADGLISCNVNTTGSFAFIQSTQLIPGNWYYFTADDNNIPGTFSISITDHIGYDVKANAVVLTDLNGWSSEVGAYSNVGATPDGNGSTCGSARHNVWFKFQATTNEVDIKMINNGTLSYPLLTLYDGSGNFISCNKNTVGSFAYVQSTQLTPGSWYYFSADDGNIPGTFSLSVTDHIGYDLKANAVLLTDLNSWSSAVGAYSNADATPDETGNTCGNPRRNVWFKFQATTNEIDIKMLNNGTLNYPWLSLYDGSGNLISCNMNTASSFARIQNSQLTPGSWYYFSADDGNRPGTFTLEIKSPPISPTISSSNLQFTTDTNSIKLNWTPGNGERRVVIMRVYNNTVNRFPSNGQSFSANSDLSQAQNLGEYSYAVYDGTGNTVTITGLTNSTEYGFGVFEYNGIGTTSTYLVNAPLLGSTFTAGALKPTVSSSNLTFTNVGSTQMTLNWTPGNGEHRVIIMNAGNSQIGRYPSSGQTFLANADLAQAQILGQNNYAIYDGTGNSVTITGLSPATEYSFGVFEYNGIGATSNYLGVAETGGYLLPSALTGTQTTMMGCALTLADEYHALMTLYQSTNGSGWTTNTGWRDANPNVVQSVSGWYGVQVDGTGHVVELYLNSNNLVGSIPATIGTLCGLTRLMLFANTLTGSIPSEIGNLVKLKYMRLDGNQLSGNIPVSIGNLVNLQELALSNNSLTGPIPTSIGNLVLLQSLITAYNPLTGSIPVEIGNLVNLTTLQIYYNQLTGSIPSSIGALVSLDVLNLMGNSLTGSLPSEIGNLAKVRLLYLQGNHLTGNIPHTIGGLATVADFSLAGNSITGSIPAEIGNLKNLVILNLTNNQLTGSIPPEIGNATILRDLLLNNNQLTGSIPASIGALSKLALLRLNNNQLTGVIPSGIKNISSIELQNNQLSSSVPINVATDYLNISNNKFTFSDFIAFKQNFANHSFSYTPQDLVDEEKAMAAVLGLPLTLSATIDRNTNPSSLYQWFKVASGVTTPLIPSPSANGHTFTIPNLTQADAIATYFYKVTNTDAPALTLTSRQRTIAPTNFDFKVGALLIDNIPNWSSADAAYSNVGATPDGTGSEACGGPYRNVWFKFQATTNEVEIKVRTGGSKGTISYPLINLFDGAGTVIACHRTSGFGTSFIQNTTLTPGSWYYFSVDNYAGDGGTFTLEVSNHIGYDLKAKAEVISHMPFWTSANTAYTNVGATPDGIGSPVCADPRSNVWFKFQATSNEVDLKIRTGGEKGTIGYSVITLFNEDGTIITCHRTSGFGTSFIQNTSLTPGSWYYFSVDNYAGDAGTFTLEVSNHIGYDLKAKAQVIPHTTFWSSANAAYSNVEATPDGIGSSVCADPGHNVWFKFQATSNEVDVKLLTGGEKGTISYSVITLFNEAGTVITCNRNSVFGTSFIQNTSLTPGSWYYFYVDNYVGNGGTFTLEVANQVSYDLKEKALLIDNTTFWSSADAAYSNIGTTPDATIGSQPNCVPPSHNVWFKFKALTSEIDIKVLTGSTKGTLFYPSLSLFDASGNSIACNYSNPTSSLQIQTLTVGLWYYFSVDSYANTQGTFSLQVNNNSGFDSRYGALLLSNLNNWSSTDGAYSNVGATGRGFNEEPDGGYRNVWFKFQATTNEIDIRVLRGGSKGTIGVDKAILFDANGNKLTGETDNSTFIQNLSLTPGSFYYFSVDDDNTGPGTFTVQINDQVGYDSRLKAVLLEDIHAWSSADAAYSNVGATSFGFNAPWGGYRNVWFKFQATTNEIDIRVLRGGSKGTIGVDKAILFDANGNKLTGETDNSTFIQNLSLTPGSFYYFSVDDDNTGPGTFTVQISDQVGYDSRLKAVFLEDIHAWSSADAAYNNVGATSYGFNAPWGGYRNVWFAFQATTNEIGISVLTGGVKGTLSSTKLKLFDNTGQLVAESAGNTSVSIQSQNLVPDSLYYFSVDDDNTGPGTFTMTIDDEVTNNFISRAQLIPDVQSWISDDAAFTNANATPDFSGSPCGGPFHNVWYKFQATDSNLEILVTSGGSKGTMQYPLITVFDSDSLAINCDGGFQKALIDSTTVTPGNWYYLSVDNYQGDVGTFTLQIKNNADNASVGCIPSHTDEYRALMALYVATNGASWTNNIGWRDANPTVVQNFQGWPGVTLNAEGHVISLNLAGNNLTGKIPASIGNLRALNKLLLGNNHLSGEIPTEIGNLTCLSELSLNDNQLTGLIPLSFENFTNLSVLNISHNNFIGIISTVIGKLNNLTSVNMQANNLSGQIPLSFGDLTKLTYLDLGANQLEAEIPTSLGNLMALTSLRLGANKLTGSIPAKLGDLAQLKDLDLHANQLTGSIPAALGSLHEMNALQLHDNQLSGTIPNELSQLTKLNKLYLNNNTLTGEIGFITGLSGLTELVIHDNLFLGAIPPLSQSPVLQSLSVRNNRFTNIPNDILQLASLRLVALDSNALASVPDFTQQINKADLELTLTQNSLTFTSLLPLVNDGDFRSLSYAPQGLIGKEKNVKAAIGQPLTLTTTIDRNTQPASTFQWFKIVNGVESALNSPSTNGHTLTIPSMAQTDEGTKYFYKITNPSVALVLTSKLQTFQVTICNQLSLDFQFERSNGRYVFTPVWGSNQAVCDFTYAWDFGDGETSAEAKPNHVYGSGGNYTVNLNVSYTCEGCPAASVSVQHPLTIDQSFCSILYCDGNGIGIGTTQIPEGYKLAVKGKVIMEGAKVLLQSKWPDYVFEKEYKLMKIQKLKEYIATHRHLPNVPSAETVKKEGIDIGEMNAVLLKKIEELTLYMIQLDDQVKKLEDDTASSKATDK